MRYIILLIIFIFCANPAGRYFETGSWVKEAQDLDNSFFRNCEARDIGDNLLLHQDYLGGFPKNILYYKPVNRKNFYRVKWKKKYNFSSIDNSSTTTEIVYLAKLYNTTKQKKYKDAVYRGINFLLDAQYENGGWAQKYAEKTCAYHKQITFNDNAMVNVLVLLNDVANKTYPFDFVDNITAQKAKAAFNKGVQCILKCQIKQNGDLTAWCSQHDKETYQPCEGRNYEKPAINAKESARIVLFLMSLENPSQDIINSVEAAVRWFEKSQIKGIELKRVVYLNRYIDFTLEPCKNCPPLWGRFYDVKTNKIFYCDRDGVVKTDISDISQERKAGYDWFGTEGIKVLDMYKIWRNKVFN